MFPYRIMNSTFLKFFCLAVSLVFSLCPFQTALSDNSTPAKNPPVKIEGLEPVAQINGANSIPYFDADFLGRIQGARYNFTDLRKPYNKIDGFAVAKLSLWANPLFTKHPSHLGRIGAFTEVIPATSTAPEFPFQDYVETNIGVQWYPFRDAAIDYPNLIRGIRLFGQFGYRHYYNEPSNTNFQDTDHRIGLDYFFENLFTEEPILPFKYPFPKNPLLGTGFLTTTYRGSNYSFDSYQTIVTSGNFRLGPKIPLGDGVLLPHVVADFTYVPKYGERWFENFLRIGPAVQYYPFYDQDLSNVCRCVHELFKRFNIFVEVPFNVAWLREDPPSGVKEYDIRIGISFSTSGFFGKD